MLEDLHGKDEKKWPAERSDFCSSRRCEGVQVRLQTNEERRELLHSKVEDYKKERLRKHVAKDRWKVRPPPPLYLSPYRSPYCMPVAPRHHKAGRMPYRPYTSVAPAGAP